MLARNLAPSPSSLSHLDGEPGQERIMSESVDDHNTNSDYALWYATASGHKCTSHLKSFYIVINRIDDATVSQEG
jgi:hypothetical protein